MLSRTCRILVSASGSSSCKLVILVFSTSFSFICSLTHVASILFRI